MSDEPKPKTGWTWLQIGVAGVAVLLVISAIVPTIEIRTSVPPQLFSIGNCRQIIAALRLYAGDHDGQYPDAHPSRPQTANQAFRILVQEGILADERIFGAQQSPFTPDREIGIEPDFSSAMAAGENHWAMTKGVKESDNGMMPLVFENPSVPGWPPKWNVDASGKAVRGRTWRGGKIIVGFNDGSVELIKMSANRGAQVPPANDANGMNAFTRAADLMEILDIEP